jgi:hypothetical protein
MLDNPLTSSAINAPDDEPQYRENTLCGHCGHEYRHHEDRYGCEVEGGDIYTSGFAPMASGPCGCKSFYPDLLIDQLEDR